MRAFLRRFDLTPARLIFLVLLGVFFYLFLIYPLAYVFINAFVVDGDFTLTFFKLCFQDPQTRVLVRNSLVLGVIVTALTTLVAVPMAYAMVRYNFRGKGLFAGLLLVPMVLPPFVGAVGMKQMFARFGSINLLLQHIGLLPKDGFIDWFAGGGLLGVVIMEVLHLYPIMYLNVAAALANIDPSMEEAAKNVGASGFTLFRRITFPLMLPGYFAGATITFIWAFTDLGTPLIFNYRNVVPVKIFSMTEDVNENPMGYVLVVLMLVLTAGLFFASKFLVGRKRFDMIARGHVVAAVRRAGPILTGGIWLFLAGICFAAMIPHMSVILTSVADKWFMTVLPEAYTLDHFRDLFHDDVAMPSIRMSLMLSSVSTVVDVALGIAIAWLLTRTRIPGRGLLDMLAMMPLAVPGIVLAFGYVAGYAGTRLNPFFNPVPLLIIAYAIRRLPYMVRSAVAGFQQTSVTLEEAAQNVGATPARTLRSITLPLVFANLVAGGILCFAFAMLEVSDSLILAVDKRFYPITRAIYSLLSDEDGTFIASALGVLGMLLLAASLLAAGKFLGRKMGELFRA